MIASKKITQSGQMFLIIALIASIIVTIAISSARLANEQIKLTAVEEDAKKALSAAEAGIEAALEQGSDVNLSSLNIDPNISGSAEVSQVQEKTFTTPLLQKDSQYTFYLSEYTPATSESPQSFGDAYDKTFTITSTPITNPQCPDDSGFALELTFINTSSGITQRKLVDPCTEGVIDGTEDEISFGDTIDLQEYASHLLILRAIAPSSSFPGVKITLTQTQDETVWPAQGITITSTATTNTNVSKKISVFQTYPQFPSEFFVTSF